MPAGRCSSAAARRAVPGSPPDLAPGSAPPRRASAARATSTRSTGAGARPPTATWWSTPSRARTRPPGAPARLGLSVSRKVGGAVERNRVKRVLRERFAELAPALPAGLDVVVIARPGRRRVPGRARLAGPGRAPGRARRAAPSRRPRSARVRVVLIAPIRLYQRGDLAADGPALQVPPDLLGLRGRGDPRVRRRARRPCWPGGGCCAATRGATGAWTTRATSGSSGREPPRAPRGPASRAPRLPPREREPHLRVVDRRPHGDRADGAAAAGHQAVLLDAAHADVRAAAEGAAAEVQGQPRRSSTRS